MEPIQAAYLGHSSGLVETDSRDRPHMGAWTAPIENNIDKDVPYAFVRGYSFPKSGTTPSKKRRVVSKSICVVFHV